MVPVWEASNELRAQGFNPKTERLRLIDTTHTCMAEGAQIGD